MSRSCFFLLLIGSAIYGSGGYTQERTSYRGHRLIGVQPTTTEQVDFLNELRETHFEYQLDFWNEPSTRAQTNIRVPPESYRRVQRSLREAGIEMTVLEEDIQRLVDEEEEVIAIAARSRSSLNYNTTFLDFDQVSSKLETFQNQYSSRLQLVTYQDATYEGRPLRYVWISKDFSGQRPAIWIEAGTHAREWITVSMAIFLIEKLASGYGTDDTVTEMLDKFDWYIVPVHNPDGYAFSHSTERLWRKNRHESAQSCCSWFSCYYQGTDLNRNWDINHGEAGSSPSCNSDTYHGGSAFSEVETRFLRDSVQETNTDGRVKAFFSIHCYSQYMLLPYGFTNTKPADYNELKAIADQAMSELRAVHGTRYVVGTPPDILYAASGGAYDYFKAVEGIKYSYTYELRPGSNSGNGFILPQSQIVPTIEETWASFVAFAQLIPVD